MKKCTKCGVSKEYAEFRHNKIAKDGHQSWCYQCEKMLYREKFQARRKWAQLYYKKNQKRIRSRVKKWRDKNIDLARTKDRARQWKRHLQRAYGMKEHEYEQMVNKQKGLCVICLMKPKRLRIDHDHETGIVRGLLCDSCNYHLPIVEDKDKLRRALEYLKK